MEIIAGVEPALRRHRDKGAAFAARAAVCNIVRKAKPLPSNITKDERRALEELRKNPDIVIAKADKGNAMVVMDCKAYEEKATEVLGKSPFKRIGKDQTKRIENRINHYLKTLRDRGSIDSDVYNELRVSVKCTRPALFYGLPKIRKPDVLFDQSFPTSDTPCITHQSTFPGFCRRSQRHFRLSYKIPHTCAKFYET